MKPRHHIGIILFIALLIANGFWAIWMIYEHYAVNGWAIFYAIDTYMSFSMSAAGIIDYIEILNTAKRKREKE